MMHFSIIAFATFLLGIAFAAPVDMELRQDVRLMALGAYITTDINWGNDHKTGSRTHIVVDPGRCKLLTDTPYDNAISSFGPDKGSTCTVYDGPVCDGASLEIWYPGYADLGWNGWNDRISSFYCDACEIGKDGCW